MSGQVSQTHYQKVAEFVKSPKAEKALGGTLLLASGTTLAVTVLKGAAVVAAFGGPVGIIAFVVLAAIIGGALLIHGYKRADALKDRVASMQQQEQQPASAPSSAPVGQQPPAAPALSPSGLSVNVEKDALSPELDNTHFSELFVCSEPPSPVPRLVNTQGKKEPAKKASSAPNSPRIETGQGVVADFLQQTAKNTAEVATGRLGVAGNKEEIEQVDVPQDAVDDQAIPKAEEIVVTSAKRSAEEEGFGIDRLFGEAPYIDTEENTNATKQTIEVTKNLKTINTSLRNLAVLGFKKIYLTNKPFSKLFYQLEDVVKKKSQGEDVEESFAKLRWSCLSLNESFEQQSLQIFWTVIMDDSCYTVDLLKNRLQNIRISLETSSLSFYSPLFKGLRRNPFKDVLVAAKALATDPKKLEVIESFLNPKEIQNQFDVNEMLNAPDVLRFKETYFGTGSPLSAQFSQLENFVKRQNKGYDLAGVPDNRLFTSLNFLKDGFQKDSLYVLLLAIVNNSKDYTADQLKRSLRLVRSRFETVSSYRSHYEGDLFKDLVLAAKALTTDPEKLQILEESLDPKLTQNQVVANSILNNPAILDFKETYFNSGKDPFLSKAFSLLEAFVEKQSRGESVVEENIFLNHTWYFLEKGFENSSLNILKAAAAKDYKPSSRSSYIQKHLEIVRKSLESDTFEPFLRHLDGRDPFKDLVLAAKALTDDPEKLQILDQSLGLKNGVVNSQGANGVESPSGTKAIPAASLGVTEAFRIVGSKALGGVETVGSAVLGGIKTVGPGALAALLIAGSAEVLGRLIGSFWFNQTPANSNA